LIKNSQPFGKNVRKPQGGYFDSHCTHISLAWQLTSYLLTYFGKTNCHRLLYKTFISLNHLISILWLRFVNCFD